MWTQMSIPAADALKLNDIMTIYGALQPDMPSCRIGAAKRASRLIDLIDEFDGLVLDGYGVVNVGDRPINGIVSLLDAAINENKPVVVLTNGGSFSSERAWEKYKRWHLPIERADVISSRDAFVEYADAFRRAIQGGSKIGCFGRSIEQFAGDHFLSYGDSDDFWQQADEFVFLGALDWKEEDQAILEKEMIAHPRPLHVVNPDLIAPQVGGSFSAEPGYWTVRLMQTAADQGVKIDIRWYGKPYAPAFNLALSRMEEKLRDSFSHRPIRHFDPRRIAMVGDSLHTDILGGAAVGMTTVLITDHGLFKGKAVAPYFSKCELSPDWVVKTL